MNPSDLELCIMFNPHDPVTVETMIHTIIPRLQKDLSAWKRGIEQLKKAGRQDLAEMCEAKVNEIKTSLAIAYQRLNIVQAV